MRHRYTKLLSGLKEVLPQQGLDELGRSVAFIRRLRHVTASAFVWSTVLSRFGSKPGFEQARQRFMELAGTIHRRPFQLRFKAPEAVELFSKAFEQAVKPWRSGSRRKPRHLLAKHFPDIVLFDSSMIQVHDALRKQFKGVAAKAAIKGLLFVSVWGLLPLSAKLVAGHLHDMTLDLPLQHFARKTLFLFDKGFIAWHRLLELQQAGMNLLCPARYNANPLVLKVNRGPKHMQRALKRNPDGVPLRELLPVAKRIAKPLDFEVLVGPRNSGARLRLVIVSGPKLKQRLYLTTLPAKRWPPAVLAEIYRLRWQIELVFKELKQHLSLDHVPTADPYAAQVLIWASLIALVVSRAVATFMAGIRQLFGLSNQLRLAPLTKALGDNFALLVEFIIHPRTKRFARTLLQKLRAGAAYHPPDREDSLQRIQALLGPV